MMELTSKYKKEEWFAGAAFYWSSRFPPIKARLQDTFRYVELHTENRSAFSYEYASILRDCGSVFGSIVDVFVRRTTGASEGVQYNFGDYRDFLKREIPDIHHVSIQVRRLFPNGMIVPFEDLKTDRGLPQWWNAYNEIKHAEYDKFRLGNLENCVTALAALAILGHLMGEWVNEPVFVNVGIAYKEDSIDMSKERRLFPKA
jgi:hypothetical protein